MLTIDELLTETPLAAARPEVVVATQRPVGWVHSSEIYEIAPLLDGGEVLLTTGLGLVGADEGALERYAEAIAAQGATALVLELGRTFVVTPRALVDACRRTGLGLIVLHAVVPFVRIGRTANERILDHEAEGLRRAGALTNELSTALLDRTGVQQMVALIAQHARTSVALVDLDGRVHAGDLARGPATVRHDLELPAGIWGELVAAPTEDRHLPLLLARGAEALRVAIAELHGTPRRDASRTLLLDLLHGTTADTEEVTRRAGTLGLPADREVAALVVVPTAELHRDTVAAIGRGLRAAVRTDLFAVTDDGVLAVVDAAAARRTVAADVLASIDAEVSRSAVAVRHLAVGTAVARLDLVADSFGAALVASTTSRHLGSDRRVVLPTDVALDRLLVETDDTALERLVTRTLGPLLEHDARRRTELLPTLLAYLLAGRSKSWAATRLGVRRQTVHERLERIATLLDLPTDEPAALTTLDVAVRAWQVRSVGAHRP